MKIKKILTAFFSLFAVILEALPGGVVLLFANPEGEPWRRTFSYFSLTPFGYANFGPFITAILTCIILIFSLISLFKNIKKLMSAIKYLSFICVITSIMPLFYGLDYITPIGISVTLVLIFILLSSFIKKE